MLFLFGMLLAEAYEVPRAGDCNPQTAGKAALQVHLRAPCLSLLDCWSACHLVLLYACCLQMLQGRASQEGQPNLEPHALASLTALPVPLCASCLQGRQRCWTFWQADGLARGSPGASTSTAIA